MIIADVAAVTLAAVLANHMGLIDAVEKVIRHKLPIINCSRCLTFWSVLICLVCCRTTAIHWTTIVATSFAASYAATWLELLFGIIDKQYEKIYEKTYPEADKEAAEAGAGATHAESAEAGMPKLREIKDEDK
jgi:hypothetical protein